MLELEIPFKIFYDRCVSDYRIGDTEYYSVAKGSKEKHCYNPYIATERDIQVKLGGIIDDHLFKVGPSFSLNSELGVYRQFSNERADLSIHRIDNGMLYVNKNSHLENLEFVIEIKYANAKTPEFDFVNQSVHKDIRKLSSLGSNIGKVFVYIDEADETPEVWRNWLLSECRREEIILFTNNKHINSHPEFIYGKHFFDTVKK
ncbi:MAG TPA: hypothetical protein VK543_15065 [Puia sp.]|nr:hypothetical protein [Puia sp.]